MQFDKVTDYSTNVTAPVIALVGGDDFSSIVSGSGVIIAPYLALTARHNIDQGFLKHFRGDRLLRQDGTIRIPKHLDFLLQAAHGDKDKASAFRFSVEAFSLSDVSDLALLRIKPMFSDEGYKWPCVNINALPPLMGERTTAYGYIYTEGELEHGTVRSPPNLYRSRGIVKEVFMQRRDRGLIDFPSFATNARCDHSMSGGPVFSQEGKLVGVISAGAPENAGEHYSIAASIWPLLGCRIEAWLPGQSQPKACSLKRLVDMGLVRMRDVEVFKYEYDEQGFVSRIFLESV